MADNSDTKASMPRFELDGKLYNNPAQLALDVIGGKWKMPILWRVREKPLRYGDLRASLNEHAHKPITHAMLSAQLKELEASGLLTRTAYPEVPPRVEYAITELGLRALPVIEALRAFGYQYKEQRERAQRKAGRFRG